MADSNAAWTAAGDKVTLPVLKRWIPDALLLDVTGTAGSKKLRLDYDLERSTDLNTWTDHSTGHALELDVLDSEIYYFVAPKHH